MQPDREWIQDKLSTLTAHAEGLKEAAGITDDPEFGAWTALKLVIFTSTIDVYTKIISKNNFDFYYIDAMAGSGVVDVKGRDDTLVSSPIIAGTVAHQPFTQLYFIEENPERAEALSRRLDYAVDEIDDFIQDRDQCIVINDDANDVLPDIPNRIKEVQGGNLTGSNGEGGAHHLAFIDNERHQISFDSIRQLESSMWGDILINYQETGLSREWGRIRNEPESDWDDFLAFFDGDARVKELQSVEDRFKLYLEKLDSINRPIQKSVEIRGSSDFPYTYRMIYATRVTGGNSEFAEFMDGQKTKIEGLTGDDINTVLDTMKGSATHLDLWSVEEGQSRLGEFSG